MFWALACWPQEVAITVTLLNATDLVQTIDFDLTGNAYTQLLSNLVFGASGLPQRLLEM